MEAKESSKVEAIVRGQSKSYKPEPLVPEPMSIARTDVDSKSFETVHPSFDEMFERFRRNFTAQESR